MKEGRFELAVILQVAAIEASRRQQDVVTADQVTWVILSSEAVSAQLEALGVGVVNLRDAVAVRLAAAEQPSTRSSRSGLRSYGAWPKHRDGRRCSTSFTRALSPPRLAFSSPTWLSPESPRFDFVTSGGFLDGPRRSGSSAWSGRSCKAAGCTW